MYDVILTIL